MLQLGATCTLVFAGLPFMQILDVRLGEGCSGGGGAVALE